MSKLNTAGELRGFLADVLVGIKDGTVDATQAHAIAKVSAQINQSLATEVAAAMKFAEMGGTAPQAGSMLIGTATADHAGDATAMIESKPDQEMEITSEPQISAPPEAKVTAEEITVPVVDQEPATVADAVVNFRANKMHRDKNWCEQCEMLVTVEQAIGCRPRHCKAKDAA